MCVCMYMHIQLSKGNDNINKQKKQELFLLVINTVCICFGFSLFISYNQHPSTWQNSIVTIHKLLHTYNECYAYTVQIISVCIVGSNSSLRESGTNMNAS